MIMKCVNCEIDELGDCEEFFELFLCTREKNHEGQHHAHGFNEGFNENILYCWKVWI